VKRLILRQESPENEKTPNGAVKPITVDREGNIHEKNAEQPSSNGHEAEKQQQDLLIKCLSEDLGFSIGRPIAAYLIYRCLVHWRSFEEERTSVFDRIIQKITGALEGRDNNDTLAYWLSNSCTLLVLLQRTLKINGVAALARQRRRASPLKVPQVYEEIQLCAYQKSKEMLPMDLGILKSDLPPGKPRC
jgi:hypothetical protein